MAKINLDKMSLTELKALRKDVDAAIGGYQEKQRKEAKKALEAVAAEHGMTVEEILGGSMKKRRSKGAPKYRNPENPDQTWSGRGRKPGWFKEAEAKGKTAESMSI